MPTYYLFDSVKLTQEIKIYKGDLIPQDTIGTIVEIYNNGEAYEVELFGDLVEYDQTGQFIPSNSQNPNAFVETSAVETLYPYQVTLVKAASQTVGIRAQLLALLDELSEDKLTQVRDFAETLR